MGLDITIKVRRPVVCPKCGEVVTHTDVDDEQSGGRIWYEFLDKIGYKNDDWYARDMELTEEQTVYAYDFVTKHFEDIYLAHNIRLMLAVAMRNKDAVVVNADW